MSIISLTGLIPEFFDDNGVPLIGGQLFTYAGGTTSKIATYTDETGATTQTNPIILNSRGEPQTVGGTSVGIWINTNTAYKFVLAPSTDTDPPTNPFWTIDNVEIADNSGSGGGSFSPLSVIAYGADPTGANDSTAAFQAWFNDLLSSSPPGVQGYIPGGTYLLNSQITWDFSTVATAGVIIFGDGKEKTILNLTSTSVPPMAWLASSAGSNSDAVTIRDIGLIGNVSGAVLVIGTTGQFATLTNWEVDVAVENDAANSSAEGVQVNSIAGSSLAFEVNLTGGSGGNGIDLESLYSSVLRASVDVAGSGGSAIFIEPGDVDGNVIQAPLLTADTCITQDTGGAGGNFNVVQGGRLVGTTAALNIQSGTLKLIETSIFSPTQASWFAGSTGTNVQIEQMLSVATTPSVPTSTTAVQNATGFALDVTLWGGTYTAVTVQQKGGGTISYGVVSTVPLYPGDSIAVTYSVAPSWSWRARQ